jgi:cation diffusion facilitator family transporter
MTNDLVSAECQCKRPETPRQRERGVLSVVALTSVMMVVEISVGYTSHSMALLADGWHMATHVGALGITAIAYAVARHFASHRAFAFGTGKVHALGGFTSSLLLGVVAFSMLIESGLRLFSPQPIDFDRSLPVACIGLLVNLVSVALLHHRGDEVDDAEPAHDHGYRAALLHVIADALTSALAIIALLVGKHFDVTSVDSATGMVGGLVILKWSVALVRTTASELLDVNTGENLEDRIRGVLGLFDDAALLDLHVWPMGRGRLSCVITIESDSPRTVGEYRSKILEQVPLSHLTIELRATGAAVVGPGLSGPSMSAPGNGSRA